MCSVDGNITKKRDGFGLSSRGVECIKSGFLYDSTVDACYVLIYAQLDFQLAFEECANMSSELIRITSQEKQDWIADVLKTETKEAVCIQGNNNNDNKQYQFDDGTPMTYFNWNTNSGDPNGGPEHYICMVKLWNYLWCDTVQAIAGVSVAFVCEK